jgi:hypothetical protein
MDRRLADLARRSARPRPPVALELANLSTERTMKLEWAFAGLPIWLISLDTCLVCATAPEPIFVGYSLHESAAGTTERPE